MELAKEPGIRLYGIDYKDDPASARRFLGRYGNPYARVGADRSGRTAIDFGVYGVPETYVIAGDGKIAYRHVGPLTEEAIREKLLPLRAAARQPSRKADAELFPLVASTIRSRSRGIPAAWRGQHASSFVSAAAAPGSASRSALPTLRRQLDGIGPAILLGPATLDEPARQEPRDDVGKRRPVDAGPIDEIGLGQALLARRWS